MKILKNNYYQDEAIKEEVKRIKPYPRVLICEQCRSELQYEESDLRMGALGCVYIDCPCCGRDNMLEENENSITLTMDNIEFPTHFFHTSVNDGAADCCNNEEIKKYIRKAIDYFRKNKDAYIWGGHITGNLYMRVQRYVGDEDYEVTVSNDFYSVYIPFEPADFIKSDNC